MNVWRIREVARFVKEIVVPLLVFFIMRSIYPVSIGENQNTPCNLACFDVAPRVGIGPTTKGLTVPCSTAELPRNNCIQPFSTLP